MAGDVNHERGAEPASTPARALDVPVVDGCRKLEDARVGHLDGGEQRVESLLRAAADRSDMSDEIAQHDEIWETRYHFARERAHVLRPLGLPRGARVLEIGAGCGAVTRYLGETCDVVDALEPTAARARIARLRTEDLESVEVFIGSLDSLPREPAYDAVVIVGVLEYVEGEDPHAERVRFLQQAAARLLPGGYVACAIENRFGVQYLAGGQEEHLGTSFSGLEDYPSGGIARTFSRAALEAMFRDAGLHPSVRHVFPDYKFARFVFDDSLLASPVRALSWRVPRWPSAASPHVRPRLANERRLWRGLVEAGIGGEVANSYLVTAGREPGADPWPRGLDAAFYSDHRQAAFQTETRVEGRRLRRRVIKPGSGPPELRHRVADGEFLDGPALIELLDAADAQERARLLSRWRELVEAAGPAEDGALDIDLVPHNLVLHGDDLVHIDQEWFHDAYAPVDIVGRGLLQLTITMVDRVPPDRWPGCETVRDVVLLLMREAGADALTREISTIARRECELLAAMTGEPLDRHLANMAAALDRPLEMTALGLREPQLRERAERALEEALRHVEQVRAEGRREIEAAREEGRARERAQEERAAVFESKLNEHAASSQQGWAAYQAVVNSRTWRMTAPLRRLGRRARGGTS